MTVKQPAKIGVNRLSDNIEPFKGTHGIGWKSVLRDVKKEKKSTYILSIISNASSSGNAGAIWGTPISLNG